MKIIKGFFKGRYKKMKTLEQVKVPNIIDTQPEWAQLCNECFCATQKNNWTKENSRKLLKQVRQELKENEAY